MNQSLKKIFVTHFFIMGLLLMTSTAQAICETYSLNRIHFFSSHTFLSCDSSSSTCRIKPEVVWTDVSGRACTARGELSVYQYGNGYPYAPTCSEFLDTNTYARPINGLPYPNFAGNDTKESYKLSCTPYIDKSIIEIVDGVSSEYICPIVLLPPKGSLWAGRLYLESKDSAVCLTSMQSYCPYPQKFNYTNLACDGGGAESTLTLNPVAGEKIPRPAGAEGLDGKSTYKLIAKVTEGGNPKAGMNITFAADVLAGSGGHPNVPGRPKGNIPSSGVTDLNGEAKITFTATAFAGTHTVTATCTNCKPTGQQKSLTFDVKVPDLSPFRPDTQTPKRWDFIGLDRYHGNNRFYLTTTAQKNLVDLIKAIQALRWATPGSTEENQSWGQVGINDASLIWGGRYPADPAKKDSANNLLPLPVYPWTGGGFHAGHNLGVEVDLRTSTQTKPNRKRVYEAICAISKENASPTLLYHYDKGPHFHAYLLGNIAPKLGGHPCWESPK